MEDVKKKIKRNQINFKKDIQPEIKKWIVKMLNVFPKQRPNVTDILADPFFNHHKQLIESNYPSQNLNSPDQPSFPQTSKISNSGNQSVHNILKTINMRDSNNSQSSLKKNDNSGISSQYKVYSTGKPASNLNPDTKKIFRFDSFKSNGDSHYSTSSQSPLNKNNVFYSFSTQNSVKRNNTFSKSGNFQNNKPTQKSNFIKSVEMKSFKKQSKPQNFVVTNDFKKKTSPQTNKLSALKNKILNSKKNTNSSFSTFQNGPKKFQTRQIYKSPIQSSSKLRTQIHSNSEQKPVSGSKWTSQSHSSSRTTPQKWVPKKFSSYQTSKLGSKLVGKNNFSTNDPEKIKINSQIDNYSSNNKFSKYSSSTSNAKTNLLSISKGQTRPKFQNHAFKSVRNPASFSSSFQSTRGLRTFTNRTSSSSTGGIQGSFNAKKNFLMNSNQAHKMNFFKKKPAQSFVKFLQPKIVRKDIKKKQSFKSNRIIPKFDTTSNGTRVVKFQKGN